MELRRGRLAPVKQHTGTKTGSLFLRHVLPDGDPVYLGHMTRRMSQGIGKFSVVGQQQQPQMCIRDRFLTGYLQAALNGFLCFCPPSPQALLQFLHRGDGDENRHQVGTVIHQLFRALNLDLQMCIRDRKSTVTEGHGFSPRIRL